MDFFYFLFILHVLVLGYMDSYNPNKDLLDLLQKWAFSYNIVEDDWILKAYLIIRELLAKLTSFYIEDNLLKVIFLRTRLQER